MRNLNKEKYANFKIKNLEKKFNQNVHAKKRVGNFRNFNVWYEKNIKKVEIEFDDIEQEL